MLSRTQPQESYIDSGNSSTAALTNGSTFTGEWFDALGAGYIGIISSIKTDQDGTLYIDFSPDTVNIDSTLTYPYLADDIFPPNRLTIGRRYVRIRFTNNSGSNQTFFRLQTGFGDFEMLTSPLNSKIAKTGDAQIVRSIGEETLIAQQLFDGYVIINKFGTNDDVDAAGEDIWDGGGPYTGFPVGTAETVDVFSSDVGDTNTAGAGARTIWIEGLDANGIEQSETLNLNGLTAVTSVNTYTRVNRGIVMTSGSSNQAFNIGTITCRHTTTTANIFFVMPIGTNQTRVCAYTIPANKVGYLRQMELTVARNAAATVDARLWIRPSGASPTLTKLVSATTTAGPSYEPIYGGIRLTALTDITMRVTGTSATNVVASGAMDIIVGDQ